MDIKPLGEIAGKYVRRASAAGPDLISGVQRAGPSKYEGSTIAAKDSWASGVQQAINRDAFAAGVQGKGPRWLNKLQTFGQTRYTQGVGAAEGDYNRGFAPYHQVIAGLSLPPKGPRGDERNYERVIAIGRALHTTRTRGS